MRRRKNRARRKDAPKPKPDIWWTPACHPVPFVPELNQEPERVHVTINGRGRVSRLRGGKP